MNRIVAYLLWPVIAIAGAFSFAALALGRGESVNAVWLVTAALSVYLIAYRFYSKFIAERVLQLETIAADARGAPQRRHGLRADEQVGALRPPFRGDRRRRPARRAGAGGADGISARHAMDPRRASCIAGAVQDFIVLFVSVRRDGKSLGEMIKMELGPDPRLARAGRRAGDHDHHPRRAELVVVKALTASPWGLFTIAATIPIALLMGVYMRIIRPGRVGEASAFGVVLLLAVDRTSDAPSPRIRLGRRCSR